MPGYAEHQRRLASHAVKALPSGYGWGYGWGGGSAWGGSAPNASGYNFAGHRLEANSVVALGLNWIADNVAKGRIVVGVEEDDGTYTPTAGHPLTSWRPAAAGGDGRRRHGLLRRPNPLHSWDDLCAVTADCLAIRGEAFWIKSRNRLTDEPEELYWAPNHQIEVIEEADRALQIRGGPIRAFRFTAGSYTRDYPPRDVVFLRDRIDPCCQYRGVSRLLQQIRNVASIDFAERATSAVLRNLHSGGFLAPKDSGQFVASGTMDEVAMDAIGRRIETQGEAENLGRIPKSSIAVDFVRTGHDVDELGLQWIAQRPTSMILAALGLNGVTAGVPSEDQATYENKKHYDRSAWENGIIPKQDRIAQAVEHQLLPDFDGPEADSCWWDRRDVGSLREDANERATRAVAMRGGPFISEDEARSLVDLPPAGDPEAGATASELTPAQQEAAAAAQEEADAEVDGLFGEGDEEEPEEPEEEPEEDDGSGDDGDGDEPTVKARVGKKRKRRGGGSAGARRPHDEGKHPRGEGGRFKDVPGAGNDRPRTVRVAGRELPAAAIRGIKGHVESTGREIGQDWRFHAGLARTPAEQKAALAADAQGKFLVRVEVRPKIGETRHGDEATHTVGGEEVVRTRRNDHPDAPEDQPWMSRVIVNRSDGTQKHDDYWETSRGEALRYSRGVAEVRARDWTDRESHSAKHLDTFIADQKAARSRDDGSDADAYVKTYRLILPRRAGGD